TPNPLVAPTTPRRRLRRLSFRFAPLRRARSLAEDELFRRAKLNVDGEAFLRLRHRLCASQRRFVHRQLDVRCHADPLVRLTARRSKRAAGVLVGIAVRQFVQRLHAPLAMRSRTYQPGVPGFLQGAGDELGAGRRLTINEYGDRYLAQDRSTLR